MALLIDLLSKEAWIMVRAKAFSAELGVQQAGLKWHSESGLRTKVKASMANKKPSVPAEIVFSRP